jgi:hypothetical protein
MNHMMDHTNRLNLINMLCNSNPHILLSTFGMYTKLTIDFTISKLNILDVDVCSSNALIEVLFIDEVVPSLF